MTIDVLLKQFPTNIQRAVSSEGINQFINDDDNNCIQDNLPPNLFGSIII